MSNSKILSFWFLHCVFRVVELQASLGPSPFDILVLEYTQHKTQAHIKDFLRYCYPGIVILRRYDFAARIGLLYSSIITIKLHKQIGNNTAFLNAQEL